MVVTIRCVANIRFEKTGGYSCDKLVVRRLMSLNYIVSAKKATVVTDAVVGNFTGREDDINLIIAKINRIEILTVTAEGLKPMQEIPVFGRILTIRLFRAKEETRDSLLILTAKYQLAIVGWDTIKATVITRAAGSVADRVGRQSDYGAVACVHTSGLIALRIYDGTLKIIQWAEGKDLRSFNVRFEDLCVIDLSFMESLDDSIRLSYISQDSNGRHLKSVELSVSEKELKTISKQDNIESEAMMIIPVPSPCSGVYTKIFIYYKIFMLLHLDIIFYGNFRFLLADDHGRLFMLLFDVDDAIDGSSVIKDLKLEYLGDTSIAECIVYLDNGVVFVGSRFGDSQLIRLTTEPQPETNSFVMVLETFTNLAPIRDIAVIETDGQTQLITCSGAFKKYMKYSFKEGSLRIIRNGIGIDEAASVDLPGGIFALSVNSAFDNYLLVSLVDETHILLINGEELEDTQLLELETNEQTLWAGGLVNTEIIIQVIRTAWHSFTTDGVTPSAIRLAKPHHTCALWQPPEGKILNLVSVNNETGQTVAVSGNIIYYVICGDMVFDEVSSKAMDYEIACVDISSIGDVNESELVAVGLWTEMSAALLSLPDLSEVIREKLPGDMLPRSIMMTRMETIVYLLIALGDGSLYYYNLDLKHVFSSNKKLVFSNVNLKLVTQICSLNSETYRFVIMNFSVRAPVMTETAEGEIHSIVILDQNTFEILHSHELGPNEHALSIFSTRLGEDPTVYFVVGTAMVYSDETEPKAVIKNFFICLISYPSFYKNNKDNLIILDIFVCTIRGF
uniref:DNA damage-binding protein 1 n=1 Tax=Heterorhabditis bacteriophora TaxID=37862 RepID=A0A1I7XBW2_HETBA